MIQMNEQKGHHLFTQAHTYPEIPNTSETSPK